MFIGGGGRGRGVLGVMCLEVFGVCIWSLSGGVCENCVRAWFVVGLEWGWRMGVMCVGGIMEL